MEIWQLAWHSFEMPDGLTASWAYDKTTTNVHMSVDDDQLPDGTSVEQRLSECYDYFFKKIYPTLTL